MLYLFHGTDEARVRAKAFAWVAAARAKEPALVYTRLAREALDEGALEQAASAGGLFVQRLLILLDEPFPRKRAGDAQAEGDEPSSASTELFEQFLPRLAASDNAVVVLAPGLTKAQLKKLEPHVTKAYVFDRTAPVVPERGFNAALANALAARDRGKLWLELVRARRFGDAPEMLHGLLHWKMRSILEKGARNWTSAQARATSLQLIALPYESRRKGEDLANALEYFALTL